MQRLESVSPIPVGLVAIAANYENSSASDKLLPTKRDGESHDS